MNKPFKLGLILGRFQHLHDGHVRMIETGLHNCERLLVLVGSSQESGTERNPFNLKIRMDILKLSFSEEIKNGSLLLGHIDDMTNEDDHSVEWGDFVINKVDMWCQHYGVENNLDCMIFGNDEGRMDWYKPEAVEHISQIVLSRKELSISATKMREFIVKNDFAEWRDHVPYGIRSRYWFKFLQETLDEIAFYKEMLKVE